MEMILLRLYLSKKKLFCFKLGLLDLLHQVSLKKEKSASSREFDLIISLHVGNYLTSFETKTKRTDLQ